MWRCSSGGTAWAVSWPPSQSVGSVRITRLPNAVAAIAAAQPPRPPPTIRMSVRLSRGARRAPDPAAAFIGPLARGRARGAAAAARATFRSIRRHPQIVVEADARGALLDGEHGERALRDGLR